MIYSLFINDVNEGVVMETEAINQLEILFSVIKNVSLSLLPIAVLTLISIFFILKLPKIKASKILVGLFYSYFGIIVFLFAVESAFMPVARTLGSLIAKGNPSFLVVIGFVMGAMVVLAEPAIWVLT